jgi:Ca-activated chloride channel family protein
MNVDDPRLTAYALGELDEFEREEIEAELKTDEAARQEVERIRRAAGILREELDAEPCPRLAPEQRAVIEERAAPAARSFPWSRILGWGVAAGTIALLVAMLFPAMSASRKSASRLVVFTHSESESPPPQTATPKPVFESPQVKLPVATQPSPQPSAPTPPALLRSDDWKAVAKQKDAGGQVLFNDGHVTFTQERFAGRSPQFVQPGEVNGRGNVFYFQPGDSASGHRAGRLYIARPDEPPLVYPGTESYAPVRESDFVSAAEQPLSTFGLDVDTASYANVRRFLMQGQLPPRDAVRIEEMLNYFSYDYPRPRGNEPFALYVEAGECPWNSARRLVLIGLKAKDVPPRKLQPMNLVFLVDVSGSMQPANKLPLIKQALRLLVRQLTERDRVAIVVYASNARVVLPSTRGDDHETILEAIERLEANGSTNGGEGIQWAYREATRHFIEGGVNRVILCTDGDFNVGITDPGELTRLIEQQARSGVFLSVFGFGMGNLKDSTMQKLADKGNGHYAYIDDLEEARKLLVDQVRSTLVTVAKDAKLQIEFNPALVDSYRLIGYEKRALRPQDFDNDRKDAGDIGAGHTVTALYEIVPATGRGRGGNLMTVHLRYKEPDAGQSQLLTANVQDEQTSWRRASDDFRFAAAVACFGMTLRDSEYRGGASFDLALELAGNARGRDEKGYRSELIEMVRCAQQIAAPHR